MVLKEGTTSFEKRSKQLKNYYYNSFVYISVHITIHTLIACTFIYMSLLRLESTIVNICVYIPLERIIYLYICMYTYLLLYSCIYMLNIHQYVNMYKNTLIPFFGLELVLNLSLIPVRATNRY
jgi:hypothetical protein